ncbi:MAG: DUF1289 domain-containing protein [Gammaproteobacteria bacterium]|nr:DUF1289 domain-containing protein [Gammaproteobacteria bacterium]
MRRRTSAADVSESAPGGESSQYPDSPCIDVCRIGDDGLCEGCLRTLDEIAAWGTMSEAERAAVYKQLEVRARSGHLQSVRDDPA